MNSKLLPLDGVRIHNTRHAFGDPSFDQTLNNLTKNYGLIYLGFGIGSIVGSIVASLFGGFVATFYLMLALLVISLIIALTIKLPGSQQDNLPAQPIMA